MAAMVALQELRVLHVVSSETFAGIERHVLSLTRELRALGCAAELACLPNATRLREEACAAGIPLLPSGRFRPRLWIPALARNVADDPPDVVHVHDGRAAVAGALLTYVADAVLLRAQHFTHPASVTRSGLSRCLSLALHRTLNRQLDGYVAVSRAVAEAARQRRETGRSEVTVIPPAVDLPPAEAIARAREQRAGLRGPVVVFAGRFEAERCLDVLLHAIPRVREQLPDCRFVLAGSGAAENDLRSVAVRLGVENAITWTGWVTDTYSVLGPAHVYVNTWPHEGFGMAMAEGMALGLPVVAVDAGASVELVDPGVTGLLVPPADPAALAAAIVGVIGDTEVLARMSRAASARALSLYGAARTARETLALYQRMVERKRT